MVFFSRLKQLLTSDSEKYVVNLAFFSCEETMDLASTTYHSCPLEFVRDGVGDDIGFRDNMRTVVYDSHARGKGTLQKINGILRNTYH